MTCEATAVATEGDSDATEWKRRSKGLTQCVAFCRSPLSCGWLVAVVVGDSHQCFAGGLVGRVGVGAAKSQATGECGGVFGGGIKRQGRGAVINNDCSFVHFGWLGGRKQDAAGESG